MKLFSWLKRKKPEVHVCSRDTIEYAPGLAVDLGQYIRATYPDSYSDEHLLELFRRLKIPLSTPKDAECALVLLHDGICLECAKQVVTVVGYKWPYLASADKQTCYQRVERLPLLLGRSRYVPDPKEGPYSCEEFISVRGSFPDSTNNPAVLAKVREAWEAQIAKSRTTAEAERRLREEAQEASRKAKAERRELASALRAAHSELNALLSLDD